MKEQNNILLITFDQMRGDWIQEGNGLVDLPNIFKLARRGQNYEKCYTNSPQCVPARLSWITGKNPSSIGVTTNKNVDIKKNARTIVSPLQKRGWSTSLVGKTHWTRHTEGKDLRDNNTLMEAIGFNRTIEICGPRALAKVECTLTDEWKKKGLLELYKEDMKKRYGNGRTKEAWMARETVLPNEYYPDIWIANRAIEELERLDLHKPWFLWISFVGPHEPFDTPEPWNSRRNRIQGCIEKSKWIGELEESNSLKKQVKKWNNTFTKEEMEKFRADYAANLMLLDEQVGKIISTLSFRKDAARTTIALTADHGEMLGDHGLLYKSTFLQPSINVPFIVYDPKNEQGREKYSTNPFNTTQALKLLLRGHKKGLSTSLLQKYIKESTEAIIEYEQEMCYVGNKYKIMLNKLGEAEWAIDLVKDKQEKNNLLGSRLDINKGKHDKKTTLEEEIKKARMIWAKRDKRKEKYKHYISEN